MTGLLLNQSSKVPRGGHLAWFQLSTSEIRIRTAIHLKLCLQRHTVTSPIIQTKRAYFGKYPLDATIKPGVSYTAGWGKILGPRVYNLFLVQSTTNHPPKKHKGFQEAKDNLLVPWAQQTQQGTTVAASEYKACCLFLSDYDKILNWTITLTQHGLRHSTIAHIIFTTSCVRPKITCHHTKPSKTHLFTDSALFLVGGRARDHDTSPSTSRKNIQPGTWGTSGCCDGTSTA